MPEYLAPGVFVEEIDGGSKPIEGVGTNTAAFVGYAKSGEFNKPIFITSWTDFCRVFGEDDEAILKALADETGRSAKELLQAKRVARKGLIEFAQRTVDELAKEAKRTGRDDVVKGWADFVRKYSIPLSSSPYIDGSYLAYAVRGYYDNGGGRAYIVRVARRSDLDIYNYEPSRKAIAGGRPATTEIGGYGFKAIEPGERGNDIKIEVTHVGEADGFTLKVTQGSKSESHGSQKDPLTPASAAQSVNEKSRLIELDATTVTATRPVAGEFQMSGGATASATALASLPIHAELAKVVPEDFVGNEADRSGFSGLEQLEDVNMVCVPDMMAGVWRRESVDGSDAGIEVLNLDDKRKEQIINLQAMLIGWCERMADRMAIVDPLPGLTPQEMRDTTMNAPFSCDHGQAAIYYPWIKVMDQVRPQSKSTIFCPPSGHIAGVWARVGVERGVHKAPANEALRGTTALEWDVTKREQEILNPNGINCIRSFPGTGIRVWGARTLATVGNPSWKYVNVRRLFNYLEKSLERGMQWVVFEPNDHDLWARVRRNISAFLWTEWKEGKLFGTVPEEAYYVKCDSETNPQEMIDLGRLYVEIGVNPVKPAEFVIIRIGQWSGGGETAEA